uniref:Glucosylceramidase n=1 Tax=Timema cristinae TaxID=61476 RepID=A0A7R9H5V1_TIMCR|nr:unnamed protein product [Timema cristinae]
MAVLLSFEMPLYTSNKPALEMSSRCSSGEGGAPRHAYYKDVRRGGGIPNHTHYRACGGRRRDHKPYPIQGVWGEKEGSLDSPTTERGSIKYKNCERRLGKWEIGERYGTSMMQAFNNWVVGWTDWNMAINEQGGPPTFDYNAAIIVNATADEFYKQPPYYFQAHFSMFVPPDSQHVSLTSENDGGLLNVAFFTPGNDVVVVLMNSQNVSVSVLISDPDREHISVGVEARSINTIIYR